MFIEEEGKSERALFIVDKDGIIRYIDIHDIDEQPDNEILLTELKKIIPDAEEKLQHLYKKEATTEGDVVMYCTPWCPDCRKARKWLRDNNITFTEVDISTNLRAARQVRSWGDGFQITPAFDIQGEIILDYDEEKLRRILL